MHYRMEDILALSHPAETVIIEITSWQEGSMKLLERYLVLQTVDDLPTNICQVANSFPTGTNMNRDYDFGSELIHSGFWILASANGREYVGFGLRWILVWGTHTETEYGLSFLLLH